MSGRLKRLVASGALLPQPGRTASVPAVAPAGDRRWPESSLVDVAGELALHSDVIAAIEAYVAMAHGTMPRNTIDQLASNLRTFAAWCRLRPDLPGPMPAAARTIAAYVDEAGAELTPATISSHLWALAKWHSMADLPDPTATERVKLARKRHARAHGVRQKQAARLGAEEIQRIDRRMALPERRSLIELRDAALLSLAYFTGFRAAELVAVEVGDLSPADQGDGLLVLKRRGKTDQEGRGKLVGVPKACAATLRAWLDGAAIEEGPVLRSLARAAGGGHTVGAGLATWSVWDIIRRRAAEAGYDGRSAHSIRVGGAQDAAPIVGLAGLMQHFGWDRQETAGRYSERIDAETAPAALALATAWAAKAKRD